MGPLRKGTVYFGINIASLLERKVTVF